MSTSSPLCDYEGKAYPEAVQALRALVLPSYGQDTDTIVRRALDAARSHEARKPRSYVCQHCRDGKDLPEGYVCKRCGADNPSRNY